MSHNMETVKRLTREVRIQAKYEKSLEVLKYLKDNGIKRTKSGMMLGLGETQEEVIQTMRDLARGRARYTYHWAILATFKKTPTC